MVWDVPTVVQLGAVAMDHEQAELLGRLSDALGPVPRDVIENAQALFRENVARRDADENAEDVLEDLKDEALESRSAHSTHSAHVSQA